MRLLRRSLLILSLVLLLWPALASAQSSDWQERRTDNFIILFTPGNDTVAEEYAGFVDGIYEDLATFFNHRTRTPITIRLFPTLESYQEVNPLARNMPGVVAHADFRRREVVVVLSQTERQTIDAIPNNVRHELAHIVASDLSDNRLNTGFQEGIAQYVELPTAELDQKIQVLATVRDQGRLMPWSDFDDRDKVYSSPEISYPQSLSVVAFLVEQYGFGTFRDFITTSARSSGYRSALERAYGVSPNDLEEQWRDWLPAYLAGGYRRSTLAGYDLAYPRQLIDQGRYAEAQTELEQAIEWLRANTSQNPASGSQQQEALVEAQALLNRSQDGQRAEQLAAAARDKLVAAEYASAAQLIHDARTIYADLGDTRQNAVLDAYAARVERGLRAEEQLQQASSMARAFRFPQARATAEAAAAEFAALGDTVRVERALALRQSLDSNQRLAGILFVAVGIIGLGMSLFGRWFWREEDVW